MFTETSKCPSCGNATFRAVLQQPDNSNYQLQFVQCAECDAVIGVLEYLNLGATLHDQTQIIKEHGSKLDRLEVALRQTNHLLGKLLSSRGAHVS